jgi:hypothetical protein
VVRPVPVRETTVEDLAAKEAMVGLQTAPALAEAAAPEVLAVVLEPAKAGAEMAAKAEAETHRVGTGRADLGILPGGAADRADVPV